MLGQQMNARYRRALGQTAMLVTPSAIACDRPSKTCQVFSTFETNSFRNARQYHQSLRRLSRANLRRKLRSSRESDAHYMNSGRDAWSRHGLHCTSG
jgi:hypothetical protein